MAKPKGEKRPPGRQSLYKAEFAPQVKRMCEVFAATDWEIALVLGITVRTLYRWAVEHEELRHALKLAKEPADDRVERSLFQRATGYYITDTKFWYDSETGKVVEKEYEKHIQASDVAAIFWLKNRRPDQWRDKREYQDPDGEDPNTITVIGGLPEQKYE